MAEDKPIITQAILHMLDDAETRFLEIGSVLLTLQEKTPHAFATLIEAPELGRRRAYYFVEISKAFEHQPHLHDRLRRIGWSKASALAKHALAPNFEELLQLAEQVSAYELKAFLKQGSTGLGGNVLMFALDAGAFAAVTQALKANGAYETPGGLREKEAALLRALSIGL
jgi:hypothetical protein